MSSLGNNSNTLNPEISEHRKVNEYTLRELAKLTTASTTGLLRSHLNGRMHRQRLISSPIELLDVVAAKGVDHDSDTVSSPQE